MKQRIFKAPKGYLRGKVIAVTGASGGIGAVAAKTFASYGATIILIGRSVPKLEKVYDEIESGWWANSRYISHLFRKCI